MTIRVALYVRVSTDKQTEKYGIPSQIEALRKRCLERGWTPVFDGDMDAFIDDGYSKEKATLEEDPEKAQTLILIFYTCANENLSLQRLADRLNRLHIPTPKGGDRWRASTLGIMLRNEVYIGRMHQFRQYRIEPRLRRQPSTRNGKTSHVLRPREEWITVAVPSLVPLELFEAVQRKLDRNAELSRRNTRREYLLSGLLYCSQCGGRMGGHTTHDVPYYRCYRKYNHDRVPLDLNGEPQPCSCPEIKAVTVETVVWNTLCQLIRDPDFLIQKLHKRTADNSQTKEILERELRLCEIRLKAMPDEHSEIAWFPVREAAKLALAHPEYPELFKKIENNLPVLHKSASPSILAKREDI